jgi:hypothetical protein
MDDGRLTEVSPYKRVKIRWPLASVLVPYVFGFLLFVWGAFPRLRELHGDGPALTWVIGVFLLYAVLTPIAHRRNKRLRDEVLGGQSL